MTGSSVGEILRASGKTVGDIARMLDDDAERLALHLFPSGRRMGDTWRVHSVAGEPGTALMVKVRSRGRGRWYDFRNEAGGDMLDLVAAVRYGGNKADALEYGLQWLGISATSAPTARPAAPAPTQDLDDEAELARKSAYAQALWLQAQERLAGTPVEAYLSGRGIDLAQLGRQPRALRFHPSLIHHESNTSWPAMVSAVSGADGTHTATHRTWLRQVDGKWKKAEPPLRRAKMMIGPMRGGSIRLWRGASRKSLREAPEGETVAIAEGIETALSVAIACPELRVLAAGARPFLRSVDLPPAVSRVILCADNDPDDGANEQAIERAVARYQAEGREVHVAMPDIPGADWNDILQGVEG